MTREQATDIKAAVGMLQSAEAAYQEAVQRVAVCAKEVENRRHSITRMIDLATDKPAPVATVTR